MSAAVSVECPQPTQPGHTVVVPAEKVAAVQVRSQNSNNHAGKRQKWQKADDKERANARSFKQAQQALD